jgi:hypothetical protein
VFPSIIVFPIVRLVFSVPVLPPLIVESYKPTVPPLMATVFPAKVLFVTVAVTSESPSMLPEIVLARSVTKALEEPVIALVAFDRVKSAKTAEAVPVTSKIVPDVAPSIATLEPAIVKFAPMSIGVLSEIVPETAKTIESPLLALAIVARRLPAPESSRLVTVRVAPMSGWFAKNANSKKAVIFKASSEIEPTYSAKRSVYDKRREVVDVPERRSNLPRMDTDPHG